MDFFQQPRSTRQGLGKAPAKRRKIVSAVEEVTYDPAARQEYLSGFQKRKQQRIKQAQQTAKEKEKLQKIEDRKAIREQRRKDLEDHVQAVNDMVKKAEQGNVDSDQEDEGTGSKDAADDKLQSPEPASSPESDQEYVDEEKFTTVTVEPMVASDHDVTQTRGDEAARAISDSATHSKRVWTKNKLDAKKIKRKKFRYESKSERKATKLHQKAKNAKAAQARREKG